MGAGVWRCCGQSDGKSAPDLLECAVKQEAQGNVVPSVSKIRCHWAHFWLCSGRGCLYHYLGLQSVT